MMICIRRTSRLPAILSRTIHTSSPRHSGAVRYHPKVKAFPFAVTPQEAIERAAAFASCHVFDMSGTLRSIGAEFLPGFFESTRPQRMQAVYLPGWYIDAHARADFYLQGNPSLKEAGSISFYHSYLPGFSFEPMSRLSFNDVGREDELSGSVLESAGFPMTVPFNEDLSRQYGVDVHCLPYTNSPLDSILQIKSLSPTQTVLQDETYFLPKSIEFDLLAVYPVLIPAYLMQYAHDEVMFNGQKKTFSCTCVVAAYMQDASMYFVNNSEPIKPDEAWSGLVDFYNDFISGEHGIHALRPDRWTWFSGITSTSFGPLQSTPTNERLRLWLEERLRSKGILERIKHRSVDMDDPRVVSLDDETVVENRRWIRLRQEAHFLEMLTKAKPLPKNEPDSTATITESDSDKKKQEAVQAIEESIRQYLSQLMEKLEKTKPAFWKKWESAQSN